MMTETPVTADMPLSLVILAAGLGSRFGGDKQLAAVGPQGETLLELSILSAANAGFSQAVLVIRPELESKFCELFARRLYDRLPAGFVITFCYQQMDDLPAQVQSQFDDFSHRQKPWGTAHALWSARKEVTGPMAVINADDYHGQGAFELLAKGLTVHPKDWMLVAYPVGMTLSEHGGVNRGVCQVQNGQLQGASEWFDIRQDRDGITGEHNETRTTLASDTLVSMTCWGFAPDIFSAIEAELTSFITAHGAEARSECHLPSVVQNSIDAVYSDNAHTLSEGKIVRVEVAREPWFGVTYSQDTGRVKEALSNILTGNR